MQYIELQPHYEYKELKPEPPRYIVLKPQYEYTELKPEPPRYVVLKPQYEYTELKPEPPRYVVLKPQYEYTELKPEPPQYISINRYFCHVRGSITSLLISSSEPSQEQACADHDMEAGKPYPMKHTCLDEDGNTNVVYSSLPRDEACKGIIRTTAINTLAGFLCEHTENPEECEEKFVTEGILPEPTMLPEFILEKRALIESIAERIRLNSPSE